ncbi:hypothetical protein [Croceivirga thetidis]|uniref:Lipocalin-like domain-containing protein n=1 Tax=Croceivirga thetidis TaxID=2721623 RepID=A0ABX1GLN5_9FLAO|nr:hypothetical protein [Croceivirga thetidis]NKI30818.1 hypothetical protein [Croceivirga thetidis]
MKKLILLVALVLETLLLPAQELDGVWMATDTSLHNLTTTTKHDSGVILLDFDKGLIGNMANSTNEPLITNRKKNKIKVTGIKGKLKVISIDNDQLVLKGAKGTTSVFKKLDLSHALELEPKELNTYLIEQHCGEIQGIQGRFTKERFFLDKAEKEKLKRKQYINFTDKANGYWYFRKINGNTFLIITVDQKSPENIFQVKSLTLKGFDVIQLQNTNRISNLSLLKTCL